MGLKSFRARTGPACLSLLDTSEKVFLVRGVLLAKGPDSSLGEVHRGSCSEDAHMEEEKVEVKVQEEEVEDGRDK